MKIIFLMLAAAVTAFPQGMSTRRRPPARTRPAAAAAARAGVRLVTREVSLGRKHAGEVEGTRTLSPDRRRVAFVAAGAGGEFVVLDGVAGKTYAEIANDPLSEAGVGKPIIFSRDGRRVAYVARRGGRRLVVVDGREGPEFENVWTGSPHFSPDGRRYAYTGRRDGKTFVVVDGAEAGPYDKATGPAFDADGRRVSYTAERGGRRLAVVDGVEFEEEDPRARGGDEEGGAGGGRAPRTVQRGDKWFVVTADGAESKPYDRLGAVRVSGDGRRVLFEASLGDKQLVVVDGVEGELYDSVDTYSSAFSPDGKHFAYKVARLGEDWQTMSVVTDGKEGPAYESVGDLAFTPDGRHLLYQAYRDRKTFLVRDGVEVASYEGRPGLIRFSPDGRRTFQRIGAFDKGKETLVVDGTPFAYDEIFNVEFSPDSQRLVFKARKGRRWVMVVDGVESKEYDAGGAEISFGNGDELAFSRDGRRVAYVGQRGGKSFVVADGVEGKPYDEVRNLNFTADGRHVVHTARAGARHLVVAAGAESQTYDGFLSDGRYEPGRLNLDGERSLSILAERGRELLRVEIQIVDE